MHPEDARADGLTDRMLEWCEQVASIQKGDDTSLPKMVQSAPTDLLMAAYGHYMDLLEDYSEAWDGGMSLGHELRATSGVPAGRPSETGITQSLRG